MSPDISQCHPGRENTALEMSHCARLMGASAFIREIERKEMEESACAFYATDLFLPILRGLP